MITFFLKSYLDILLAIGISSAVVFLLGIYYIINKSCAKTLDNADQTTIAAIAGEDLIATQLDLACAYIQVNKHDLAKKILESVLTEGNADQQQEAQRLLDTI